MYLNDENVKCNKVEMVSNPDALTKSFKVEICYIDKTKVLSEDIWQQGIGCSVWWLKLGTCTVEQRFIHKGHTFN